MITTATYEATAFGVHSGMGLMKAAKLAPDALLLPADFDEYRRLSRLFKDAVRALAPDIEDRGIDEIYVDITRLVADSAADGAPDPWARARVIAKDIQRAVREATGLSCSLGVTPNKLLSKIASELEKPGGVTVLRMEDVSGRIWPLPARKINGIGPKADARLEALGIRTLDAPTGDAAAIRRAAGECLKRVPLDRRIRLLGVRVGSLSRPGAAPRARMGHKLTLFGDT